MLIGKKKSRVFCFSELTCINKNRNFNCFCALNSFSALHLEILRCWGIIVFGFYLSTKFRLFIPSFLLKKYWSNIWAFSLVFRSGWPFRKKARPLGWHLGHFKKGPFGRGLVHFHVHVHVHVRRMHQSSLGLFGCEYLRVFFLMKSGSKTLWLVVQFLAMFRKEEILVFRRWS